MPKPPPAREQRLSPAQRLAWLRLARSESIGPITFREAINHYGGAEQALEALPKLARFRKQALRICPRDEALQELERADEIGATLVVAGELGYPIHLATIEAPPPVLYVKGKLELAARPAVAIVGARDASAAGRKLTRTIAIDLGKAGLVVASGLARGIDAAAHEASLATGTIAVVAGGIDIAYPPENRDLHRLIGEQGLLVAENAPGLEPRGRDFPRRNRIISGASIGVLVVEAALRSGSRITAGFALEQGRELFAVPGHPLDPRAEGTNHLLKQGATLVTRAADILEVLEPLVGPSLLIKPGQAMPGQAMEEPATAPPSLLPPSTQIYDPSNTARALVIEALGAHPTGVDEIVRATALPLSEVRVILLELDLAGRIVRSGGNRVALNVSG